MDILKISRSLGHDKPTTTLNVYGHLIKDRDDDRRLKVFHPNLMASPAVNPMAASLITPGGVP
jgi:hypothetical protein